MTKLILFYVLFIGIYFFYLQKQNATKKEFITVFVITSFGAVLLANIILHKPIALDKLLVNIIERFT